MPVDPCNDRSIYQTPFHHKSIGAYIADDRNVLVLPVFHILFPGVTTKVPASAVDEETVVTLQALDVWPFPATQDTDTHEQEVGGVLELLELALHGIGRAADEDMPFRALFVVAGVYELVLKFDVGLELVPADDAFEVTEDLVSVRVEGRPVSLINVSG